MQLLPQVRVTFTSSWPAHSAHAFTSVAIWSVDALLLLLVFDAGIGGTVLATAIDAPFDPLSQDPE